MAIVAATLLAHRGHGPYHADLILGTGRHCATIRLGLVAGRVRATPGSLHRRRYLRYRGPVSGRGTVVHAWHGRAWSARSASRLRCRLFPNQMFLMKIRQIFGAVRGPLGGVGGGRGELVVPLQRMATLPRS